MSDRANHFPVSTAPGFTSIKNRSPGVPSRRSRLMQSPVTTPENRQTTRKIPLQKLEKPPARSPRRRDPTLLQSMKLGSVSTTTAVGNATRQRHSPGPRAAARNSRSTTRHQPTARNAWADSRKTRGDGFSSPHLSPAKPPHRPAGCPGSRRSRNFSPSHFEPGSVQAVLFHAHPLPTSSRRRGCPPSTRGPRAGLPALRALLNPARFESADTIGARQSRQRESPTPAASQNKSTATTPNLPPPDRCCGTSDLPQRGLLLPPT